MIIELIIGIAGVAAALVGARGVTARVAVNRARRDAQAAIAAFKAENAHMTMLPLACRPANAALLEMIRAARRARETMMARAKETHKIAPHPIAYLPELQHKIEGASICFFQNMKTVYLLKARDLVAGQAASRFDDAFGIAWNAKPHLSQMEQRVVDLLDQVGAISIAEQSLELIPEVLRHFSDTMADAAVDGISDVAHAAATAFHLPGLLSGTRDAISEIQLLMNDDVSLADSFRDGVLPTVARTIMLKVGLVLDAATGWASLGGFTVVCTWLGRVAGHEMLQQRLGELVAEVQMRLRRIEARQREALNTINDAVNELIREFADEVEKCPDIGDEPALVSFLADLHAAYRVGLADAVGRTATCVRVALADLPERTRLDRLLGIDRGEEIAALYRQAQREIDSQMTGVVHAFSLAAESHVEDALAFLERHPIFANEQTRTVLARLADVHIQAAASYSRSLTKWARRCEEVWVAGTQRIEEVTAREHALTAAVVEEEAAAIREARRKIAVLRRRLRMEPVPVA